MRLFWYDYSLRYLLLYSAIDSPIMKISYYIGLTLSITFLLSSVQAADITWGVATNTTESVNFISEPYVYALNGGFATPVVSGFTNTDFTNLPTGVTFAAAQTPESRFVNNVESTPAFSNAFVFNVINSFTDSLSGITFGTMTFASLTNGQKYQIQVFYNDQRVSGAGRSMIYGDGTNTVSLAGNDGAVGGSNEYGQFVIGTFIASGTTQDLTMEAVGFGNLHYNAVLIKRIPEPSAYTMIVGVLALALVMIRRLDS